MSRLVFIIFAFIIFIFIACTRESENKSENKNLMEDELNGSFSYDLNFLKSQQDIIVLSGNDMQAQLIVCPGYQARVMTSTAEGLKGPSLGWINYDLIKSKTPQPHINVYGGEDRFWIGPEGGQYSIFFKKGDPFDLDHWQTPSSIDTEAFDIIEKQKDKALFQKKIHLENYQGSQFDLLAEREVTLLSKSEIEKTLQTPTGILKVVGFQSINKITNTGQDTWTKSKGLLSIWILGMFPSSSKTNVVIPYKGNPKDKFVNDRYFGKLTKERLSIQSNAVFFMADGMYRSKIGIPQENADSIFGSYDGEKKIMTIIQYSLPVKPQPYVNSIWKIQKFPYQGDVLNAYNDGPSTPGEKGMGSFYELETSSPALELKPLESAIHIHRTFHIYGNEQELNRLSKKIFGVHLIEITEAFNK